MIGELRICPMCGEFLPHYCAATVRMTVTRLPSRQGQRTRWRKTIIIQDRMPPYAEARSTLITTTRRGWEIS